MTEVEIINYRAISHMAMSTVHSIMYSGQIKAIGHILHGKTIRVEEHTKKNKNSGKFGKTTQSAYLNEVSSHVYKSIGELLCAHKCYLRNEQKRKDQD
jgi:hypothetical protein